MMTTHTGLTPNQVDSLKFQHTPGKWTAIGEFIGTNEEDTQTIAVLMTKFQRLKRL